VQPGVTAAELSAELARVGRRFAPTPVGAATCTIGGMVATNASGGTAFRHGYTRDHVLGLRVVWDDGTADSVLSTQHTVLSTPPDDSLLRTVEIRAQTSALLAENRDLIQLTRPLTRFNRCGYVLHDVLTPAGLDLAKLLVGSEGTLGLVTEATVRTIPLAGGTSLAVLGFPTVDAAVRAGLALRSADGIVGCDLLDQRLLALSRAAGPAEGVGLVPPAVGAALIVTCEGETEKQAEEFGRAATDRLRDAHRVGVLAAATCDPDGVARVRRFRDAAVGGLYALGTGPRPVAGVEDVAVPAEELPRFLAEVRALLQKFDVTASVLVHVLAGQVHTRPFVDLDDPKDRAKLWPLAEAVHTLALSLGGTVSTQHGTGLARTPWVEKQYGPLMPVFRELKRIFDPKGILNPGKIVGPDPSRPAWPLRPGVRGQGSGVRSQESGASSERKPLLIWGSTDPATVAASCNGCGDCRSRAAARMCPVFRASGAEEATPRAKANLLRRLLTPGVDPAALTADEVREVAGLCVNCKMCRDECRGRVDVPKLMLEAKAAHHAEHGLDRADWGLARMEALVALAGNFSFTTNAMLGSRPARWLIEKLFGLSRRRALPRFTHRTFLRRARKLGLTRNCGLRIGRRRFNPQSAIRNPQSAGRLLRGQLRELQRPASWRGGGRSIAAPRVRGPRAAAAEGGRDGTAGGGGCRDRAGGGGVQHPNSGGAGPRRVHRRLLRADRGAGADPGLPGLARRPGREAGGGEHRRADGALVATARGGGAADRLPADRRDGRAPRPLPRQGAAGAGGRAEAARIDPRDAGAYHRRELLRDGRHLGADGRQPRGVAGRGQADAR
jgi:FAD/FMN-containing dehydrogenase